jgi:primosomal protein N' (replication factor Y)
MSTPLTTLYATVAVDQPLDATYTYLVPPSLAKDTHRGSRVTVPLGRSNRPTPATILNLSPTPPAIENEQSKIKNPSPPEAELFTPEEEAPDSEFKSLLDLHRDVLPIPGDLLDLAQWISTYYCAPVGMTLATMVPAAVKRATRLPATLLITLADPSTPPADQLATRKASPKTRKLFEQLYPYLQPGPKTEQEVLTHAEIARPALKRLLAQNLLRAEREIKLPDPALIGADLQSIENQKPKIITLSPDQQTAMDHLTPLMNESGFAVRLIHGVTGSGKTELYIRAIESIVAQGKTAIVLVPEISLTPQTVRRFTARFPRVAVLHSGMKDSERHQHWHAIATGWAQVVVGARSAIFAPAKNIGLIVVDEEHDGSYKQDNLPKYHGRDVAIRRAQMLNIPILLGSATPALESWHNAHTHKDWRLLSLTQRPLNTQMPRVLIVDMKSQEKERRGLHILSTTLEHHLKQTLEQKKQAIFLLNRRGYAHYLMCPRCDWVLMCDNCDATMVVHRKRSEEKTPAGQKAPLRGTVQCHYCLTSKILPDRCPLCQARLTHLGQGTQRAEDELLRKFPTLRLKRMDSDSMTNAGHYQAALDAFGRGEIDLLIGTQMIAKGLDFPNVSLVGVLNSDLAMTIPDFRAAERTFQLICQVAGRSGRVGSTSAGTVVVQTYQPHEPAIAHACNHDYLGFVRTELPHRQEFGYPPYGRLVRIVLAHKSFTKVHTAAEALERLMTALTHKLNLPIRIQGPFPPPMERLVELYRSEFVLFASSPRPLQQLIASLRGRGLLFAGNTRVTTEGLANVTITVDVDPLHML